MDGGFLNENSQVLHVGGKYSFSTKTVLNKKKLTTVDLWRNR